MKQIKILTVVLAGLLFTGCSEDQNDQAKNAMEEMAAPAIEKTENVVEEAVEEVKQAVAAVTESAIKEEVSAPEITEVEVEEPVQENTAVEPQTHIIKAAVTSFRPLVVFANPGDTIVWQNMNGHDTTSMSGMIPEGAEAWQSKLGEVYSITVEAEGVYLYKCTPHVSMGMMGAIIVNNTDNLEAIKAGVDTSGEPKGMVKRVIRKVEKELSK